MKQVQSIFMYALKMHNAGSWNNDNVFFIYVACCAWLTTFHGKQILADSVAQRMQNKLG